MTKTSPAWGFMLPGLFFAWCLIMRVTFVMAGFSPGDYTGARGFFMLLLASFGTAISAVVAWENSPNGSR